MTLNLTTKLRKKLSKIEVINKVYSKLILPKLYINFWITLRCNYRCSYCIVQKHLNKHKEEKTMEEWTEALLKLPKATIAITGGEPFLYKGAAQLINNLSKKHRMALTTNLTFPEELMKVKDENTFVCLSYQRETISLEEFAEKVKKVKSHFKKVSINYVNTTNEDTSDLREVFEKKLGVLFNDDPEIKPTDEKTGKKISCTAGSTFLALTPNGNVYTCSMGFYNHKFYIGNIFDKDFKILSKPIICDTKCVWDCDQDYTIRKPINK